MGLTKTAVTVVLTFLISAGVLVAAIACGPANGGKAFFMSPPKGKDRQVSCLAQFSGRYGVRVDSDKMTVDGKSIHGNICQAEQGVDYTPYTLPPGTGSLQPVAYKPISRRISYQIEKVDKSLSLKLSIGVDFGAGSGPGSASDEAKMKTQLIDSLCLKPLKNAWRESGARGLDLNITMEPIDNYDSKEFDQILTLKSSSAEAGREQRYVAVLWPDRGQFIPQPPFESGCSSECKREKRAKVNLRFCANLAMVIGQWLGLKASESETANCRTPTRLESADEFDSAADEEEGFATGLARKSKDFMVSADPASPEFWSTARFSRADIARILEPACKGKLKPGEKTPATAAATPAPSELFVR